MMTRFLFSALAAAVFSGTAMLSEALQLTGVDGHNLGLSILGLGGGALAWLFTRQIAMLDETLKKLAAADAEVLAMTHRNATEIAVIQEHMKFLRAAPVSA